VGGRESAARGTSARQLIASPPCDGITRRFRRAGLRGDRQGSGPQGRNLHSLMFNAREEVRSATCERVVDREMDFLSLRRAVSLRARARAHEKQRDAASCLVARRKR
jgi:hypothetical protein